MTTKTEYRAPALERALDIIELLSKAEKPMTKKEITLALGKTVNEVFRILEVLKHRGYVSHNAEFGTYGLSLRLFQLSNQQPTIEKLISAARPLLKVLAREAEQSCHVTVCDNSQMLVVVQQDSAYKMGFSVRLGAQIDIHASGSGLVYLAAHSETEIDQLLDKVNVTKSERDYVFQQIKRIKQNGYYVGISPQVGGLTNISYPLYSLGGHIEGVLTVPYLEMDRKSLHYPLPSFDEVKALVESCARNISTQLGQAS